MQRLVGRDWVFVHAGGMVIERELASGQELHVDAGCLVAQMPRSASTLCLWAASNP